MATIGQYPPAGANQMAMGSIPGVRFSEGVVFAVEGPDPVGPEAAQAVLVLEGALDQDDKAQQFWSRAAVTLREARESTGFIRFIAFADGLTNYALGFWRTRDDAMAFFRSPTHTEAMRELDATGNQYEHFAALFNADRQHERHVYCEGCGKRNVMPTEQCVDCGNELVDSFKVQSAAAAPAG
jgi:heme-degrading monooxygenase HmoA